MVIDDEKEYGEMSSDSDRTCLVWFLCLMAYQSSLII